MSIINNLIKKDAEIKHKIILRKYCDINEIFNSDTTMPLEEAILNYNYSKYLLLQYNITCKIVENIYKEFINNISVLINDIKYDPSSEDIMYIFCYLMYNGYLSQGNKFIFDWPTNELDLRMALSVIFGQGVCRNVGAFLNDILKEFNFETYGIITDRSTFSSPKFLITQDLFNLCNSDLTTFEKKSDEYFKTKKITNGDHFEVLVHDKKWLLFDPSNIGTYRIIRKDNGYSIMNYLKFYSLYALGTCDINKTMKLYRLFKDKYLVPNNTNESIKRQEECFNICEQSKQKILRFRNDNERHIELLSEAIRSLKK